MGTGKFIVLGVEARIAGRKVEVAVEEVEGTVESPVGIRIKEV